MQKRIRQSKMLLWPLQACVLFCAISFPVLSFAQSDTSKKLNEVKVNSKPIPQIQTATPSQQISSADFDRYSALNIADAIRNFAGVNIKDYGGIGGLKTVSVRSLGANHLAVLYDGVQINDTQNGQIDLGRLNLNNVQEIVLYNAQPEELLMPARSFASASVLSIKTIRPNLTTIKPYKLLFGIRGGSFGLVNPYMQWQQRVSSKWSFIINSYLENANGHYKYKVNGDGADTSATRTNSGLNVQSADGALYWSKNDSNKFNLHLSYYNSNRGLPGAVVFYNPTSNQHLWNKDFFVQSGYERLWKSSFHLLINIKLSQDYTRYVDPDYLNNQGGLDERYTQREFYQSAALSYHLLSNWEMSYAADASISDLNANLPDYSYPTRFSLLNVLATKLILGRWHFQGNLLNTYINERVKTGTASPASNVVSPTVMVVYQPKNNANLQFRAFYKDIFRYPTFNDLYFFPVNGPRNLKPEYAKQFDAGITYRKGINSILDFITFSLDGYYNNLTNKIIYLPGSNIAMSSIINLGKVVIKGIDVGIKTQTVLINGWRGSIAINYTFQDAIDVTDPISSVYRQQIPYTPKNTIALNGGADYKNIGLYYNQVLSSDRYYLGENLPANLVYGYSVSDLSFIYKFLTGNKPVVLSAHIDNVFNESYVIVRSFPMPGRSFILSFQITI